MDRAQRKNSDMVPRVCKGSVATRKRVAPAAALLKPHPTTCCGVVQAAAAVGKRYIWAVDDIVPVGDEGVGPFARLLTLVSACVAPDPAHRPALPRLVKALASFQGDSGVAAAALGVELDPKVDGAGGRNYGVAAPTPEPVYDVLAIVSAMEALSVDTTAVIDAIGGQSTSPLDTLRAAGVSYVKCRAMMKALAAHSVAGTTHVVKVGQRQLWPVFRYHALPDDAVVPQGLTYCEIGGVSLHVHTSLMWTPLLPSCLRKAIVTTSWMC